MNSVLKKLKFEVLELLPSNSFSSLESSACIICGDSFCETIACDVCSKACCSTCKDKHLVSCKSKKILKNSNLSCSACGYQFCDPGAFALMMRLGDNSYCNMECLNKACRMLFQEEHVYSVVGRMDVEERKKLLNSGQKRDAFEDRIVLESNSPTEEYNCKRLADVFSLMKQNNNALAVSEFVELPFDEWARMSKRNMYSLNQLRSDLEITLQSLTEKYGVYDAKITLFLKVWKELDKLILASFCSNCFTTRNVDFQTSCSICFENRCESCLKQNQCLCRLRIQISDEIQSSGILKK